MIGRVVSVKNTNTATVLVTGSKTHPLYKKTFVSSKKFLVDDSLGVTLGQIVEIVPTKPISKRKFWKITKVVGRDIEAIVAKELKEQAAEIIEEVMPEISESVDQQVSVSEEKTENTDTPTNRDTEKPKQKKVAKKEKK